MPGYNDDDEELELDDVGLEGDGDDEGDEADAESGGDAGQEDGQEGGEAGDSEDEAGQEVPPQQVSGKPSRANGRIRDLVSRAAEEKAAREKAEKELAEFRAERTRQEEFRRAKEAEERARNRDLLSPEERIQADMAEMRNQLQFMQQRSAFDSQDAADRTAFAAKAASNPVYAKYADQVEAHLADLRRQGQNVTREALLAYVVGRAALDQSPAPKKPGAAKTRKVPAAPNARNSLPARAAASPASERERLFKKLENIPLGGR
jgi:hypothetical protein